MGTRVVLASPDGERDAPVCAGGGEHACGPPGAVAPAGRIPAAERHALAVRQSLRWAERAAREGDYEGGLSWLATVESVDGALPEEWRRRREEWAAARAAQDARGPCERRGPDGP